MTYCKSNGACKTPAGCFLNGCLAAAPSAEQARVIDMVLDVVRLAYDAMDNTEDDGNGLHWHKPDFDALSEAMDKVEELPDDQPGYVMGPAAKARWALRGWLAGAAANSEQAVCGGKISYYSRRGAGGRCGRECEKCHKHYGDNVAVTICTEPATAAGTGSAPAQPGKCADYDPADRDSCEFGPALTAGMEMCLSCGIERPAGAGSAQLATTASASGESLGEEEIDRLARKHNLDGSMLVGARHDYWRAFAADVIRTALARAPLPAQDGQAVDDARDAARYRWLRNEAWGGDMVSKKFPHVVEYNPGLMRSALAELAEDGLDQAIDAAMSASRPDDKGEAHE